MKIEELREQLRHRMAKKLPADKKQRNQVILGLQKAIEDTFSDSEWKELGYQTGTQDWISNHPRLLRSLSWGDADYAGHVLDAIEHILEEDPSNLDALLENDKISARLKDNHPDVLALVVGIAPAPVAQPPLKISTQAVETALADAEALIKTQGPASAVDRVHTALHGFFLAVCDAHAIAYNPNPGVTELFKAIRQHHPTLQNLGTHGGQITLLLQHFAGVVHVVNELRNQASGAHPSKHPLGADEAMLAINGMRTVFAYLNGKL